jgi:ribulose-phosphate 3-epimerase
MDGVFTPNVSIAPEQMWWPEDIVADVHLMFQKPESQIDILRALKPSLVIVHAESDCNVVDFAKALNQVGIACGVALFPETSVDVIAPYASAIQHALIFSGNLGHQGGSVANLDLLKKVEELKVLNPELEIAWDGGVNDSNVAVLTQAGVDVVNAGGYIHTAHNAELAYNSLNDQLA